MTARVKHVIKILEELCGDVELVSYGLAPNSDGFCYEVINDDVKYVDLKRLDEALDSLTSVDEEIIKDLYLR